MVEDEAHLNYIPHFTVPPSVVAKSTALRDESRPSVQPDGRLVMRPYIEPNLVGALRSRPGDGCCEEGGPLSEAARCGVDEHSERRYAVDEINRGDTINDSLRLTH